MLSLDDPKWRALNGGYKVPYDASVALKRLEHGEDAWDDLWEELHHQGDVGEASYAAVPHLVRIGTTLSNRDWNLYALVSCIEVERHRKTNPPLPDWLVEPYHHAMRELLDLATSDLKSVDDQYTVWSILGAIALAKGELKLGALISMTDESEIEGILEETDAWSETYRSAE